MPLVFGAVRAAAQIFAAVSRTARDSMSFEEGALLEPLSVAYSAIEKLDFHKDSRLVILGAGSIGLLMGVLMQELYPSSAS